MLFIPLSPHTTRRWIRRAMLLLAIAGALAIYRANARSPRDLSAFDRLVLSLTAPVQRALSELYYWSLHQGRTYLAVVHVRRDNLILEQKVALLEHRLQRLREVELENQRLRKLLDFTSLQDRTFRTARVVGVDPSSHFRTHRIDRGTRGGVDRGMAVVTAEGAVGRVLRVWSDYADVLLISDAQSGIDCLVQRTRARGTVEGMGGPVLRMKYLLRMDEVQEGDLVITSGADGIFPPGLLVGTVSGLRRQATGVFQEVQIVPAVDLTRLEEVLVLQPPLPPLDGVGETPAMSEPLR